MQNMSDKKILIVDDDPNNLRILELDLEEEGYEILTASDGVEAWDILQEHKENIILILLDRMMPNMNGMEFMKKHESDKDTRKIPVIMQTAAAEKKQVAEGIAAGVYYYLTKPYDVDVMLSIVRSAIKEYLDYMELLADLKIHTKKLHIIKESTFELKTLEEAKYLATFLANYYPDSERVILGISELLVNAIEHGNLNITYDEKSRLNKEGKLKEEIENRLLNPLYKDKKVTVNFKRDDNQLSLRIKDEGKGFDWHSYLEISPERAMDNHGRGIALSKMTSFDSMEYIGCGNEVVCYYNYT